MGREIYLPMFINEFKRYEQKLSACATPVDIERIRNDAALHLMCIVEETIDKILELDIPQYEDDE
jgi:hypothetical protein